jgi:hypothetical protein
LIVDGWKRNRLKPRGDLGKFLDAVTSSYSVWHMGALKNEQGKERERLRERERVGMAQNL